MVGGLGIVNIGKGGLSTLVPPCRRHISIRAENRRESRIATTMAINDGARRGPTSRFNDERLVVVVVVVVADTAEP